MKPFSERSDRKQTEVKQEEQAQKKRKKEKLSLVSFDGLNLSFSQPRLDFHGLKP